jgi:hypothetical protein
MGPRQMIWIGAIAGSTLGGMVPGLWHAPFWSLWGVVLSGVGGLAGIWAGWKIGQRL